VFGSIAKKIAKTNPLQRLFFFDWLILLQLSPMAYFIIEGLVGQPHYNGEIVQCAPGDVASASGRVKAVVFDGKRLLVKAVNLRPADASIIAELANCLLTCQFLVLKLSGLIVFKVCF
jgi:hypothetical protein